MFDLKSVIALPVRLAGIFENNVRKFFQVGNFAAGLLYISSFKPRVIIGDLITLGVASRRSLSRRKDGHDVAGRKLSVTGRTVRDSALAVGHIVSRRNASRQSAQTSHTYVTKRTSRELRDKCEDDNRPEYDKKYLHQLPPPVKLYLVKKSIVLL